MNILLILLIIFVVLPCLELVCFTTLGTAIGLIPTLTIILGTGMLGAFLAKKEGVAAWERIKYSWSSCQDPSDEIVNGFCILIAGIALFVPGFITDIIGFVLLAPFVRKIITSQIRKHWHISKVFHGGQNMYEKKPDSDPDIIDVKATVDEDPKTP